MISLQATLSELVNHPRLALGILDEMEKEGKIAKLLEMEHNSVEYLHTVIEALRLSFADTRYAPPRETQRPISIVDDRCGSLAGTTLPTRRRSMSPLTSS